MHPNFYYCSSVLKIEFGRPPAFAPREMTCKLLAQALVAEDWACGGGELKRYLGSPYMLLIE
jgi:hypothetical protein